MFVFLKSNGTLQYYLQRLEAINYFTHMLKIKAHVARNILLPTKHMYLLSKARYVKQKQTP